MYLLRLREILLVAILVESQKSKKDKPLSLLSQVPLRNMFKRTMRNMSKILDWDKGF